MPCDLVLKKNGPYMKTSYYHQCDSPEFDVLDMLSTGLRRDDESELIKFIINNV